MPIPVTLEEAKRQLKLLPDQIDQDDEIADFIADAAAWVEGYTGHILVARDVTQTFPSFAQINMRAWPIKAGAVFTVGYGNPALPNAVIGARMVIGGRRATFAPAFGSAWPTITDPVTVSVRAGYEVDDAVPGEFRRAMLVLIGAYDDDREGGDVFASAETTARRLCKRFKAQRL